MGKLLVNWVYIDDFNIGRKRLPNGNVEIHHRGYETRQWYQIYNIELRQGTPQAFVNWKDLLREPYFKALSKALLSDIPTRGILFRIKSKDLELVEILQSGRNPKIAINLQGKQTLWQNQAKGMRGSRPIEKGFVTGDFKVYKL
jgi:hypothetical protein